MGYYINGIGTSYEAKIANLKDMYDAKIIDKPTEWEENLVCVVDNGVFAAAGYAYDEREMNVFLGECGRPKTWLKVPNAKELAK